MRDIFMPVWAGNGTGQANNRLQPAAVCGKNATFADALLMCPVERQAIELSLDLEKA